MLKNNPLFQAKLHYNNIMEVTQEIIDKIFEMDFFDGTCPFAPIGVECGKGCMTVEECNKCKWTDDDPELD